MIYFTVFLLFCQCVITNCIRLFPAMFCLYIYADFTFFTSTVFVSKFCQKSGFFIFFAPVFTVTNCNNFRNYILHNLIHTLVLQIVIHIFHRVSHRLLFIVLQDLHAFSCFSSKGATAISTGFPTPLFVYIIPPLSTDLQRA